MSPHEANCLDMILSEVKTIKEILTGNGSPDKGVIVRLDRVEQKQKRHTWIVATLFTVTLGALATAVFEVVIPKLF